MGVLQLVVRTLQLVCRPAAAARAYRVYLIIRGEVVAGLKPHFCKNQPLLVDFKTQTRPQKTWSHVHDAHIF